MSKSFLKFWNVFSNFLQFSIISFNVANNIGSRNAPYTEDELFLKNNVAAPADLYAFRRTPRAFGSSLEFGFFFGS